MIQSASGRPGARLLRKRGRRSQPSCKALEQLERAYDKGHQYKNAISFSGGSDKAVFSSAFSYMRQNGLIPSTYYQDATAKLNGQLKFSDRFKMGTSLYYANTYGNFYDADRYNEELIYWAPRWDVRDYIKTGWYTKNLWQW